MPKVLFLANCQGRHFPKFLSEASDVFEREWTVLDTIQAQKIGANDATWLRAQMDAADVLIAQPLYSMPVEDIRPPALRKYSVRTGKQLIMLPALQWGAFQPGVVSQKWGADPAFPFDANEDMAIAASYMSGMTPRQAVDFYHDKPLLAQEYLSKRIDHNLSEFVRREREADCDILASPYYAQHARTSRLHFMKGHPLPAVTAHFSASIGGHLGLEDFDVARTSHLLGAFGYSLPIPRWVKAGMALGFEDPDDQVCCKGKNMSLREFVETMFDWYGSRSREEIENRLGAAAPYRWAMHATA